MYDKSVDWVGQSEFFILKIIANRLSQIRSLETTVVKQPMFVRAPHSHWRKTLSHAMVFFRLLLVISLTLALSLHPFTSSLIGQGVVRGESLSSKEEGARGRQMEPNRPPLTASSDASGTTAEYIQRIEDDPLASRCGLLFNLYQDFESPVSDQTTNWAELLHVDENGNVPLEIVAKSGEAGVEVLLNQVAPLGFQLTARWKHVVSGKIPVASLRDLAACDELMSARPVLCSTNAGFQSQRVGRRSIPNQALGMDGSNI
jgi:hypothetical protein